MRARRERRGLDVVRDRDRADGADVTLLDALLRFAPVLPELQLARHEVLVPEPDDDLLVADVLAPGRELDHVGRRPVDRLVAAQARARVLLRPRGHLLDQVQVVIAEIRPHEALVAGAGGDLPHALELGEIEPLIGRAPLVHEGEEAGALHLGGGEEEADRLLLVTRIVHLHLAQPLPAPPVDDRQLQLLVAIVPVPRGVVERLPPIEDLARRLAERRRHEPDEQGERGGDAEGHGWRVIDHGRGRACKEAHFSASSPRTSSSSRVASLVSASMGAPGIHALGKGRRTASKCS